LAQKIYKVSLRLMNVGDATVFSQLTKSVAKVCAQINGVRVLVARKVWK
jgi:hypothetical protein